MPAKIIAVWFFKGGVGKTTTSVNVAAELARQGYRTAILDFDGQCNVTQMLVPPQTDASSGDEGDGESEDDIEFVEDRIVEGEPPIFHASAGRRWALEPNSGWLGREGAPHCSAEIVATL